SCSEKSFIGTLFCSVFVLFACVISANADYRATVLAKSPVGYWRLNDAVATPGEVLATNIGTLGAVGNGLYLWDVLAGAPGALPAQPTNTAVRAEAYID